MNLQVENTLSNTVLPACVLSIVVPAYNEEVVLPILHSRLVAALSQIEDSCEIIYVDDGSSDNSRQVLKSLCNADPIAGFVSLSRNFGKEAAMCAGLRAARGQAIILIDADLQDPPELIASMLAAWRQGADVVNMHRRSRAGETWFKTTTAHMFYRVINRMSEVPVQKDVGDFRLLSRRAVDAFNQLPEKNRFMKGLFAWIGYKQVTLDYDRDARAAGTTKWRYWKLWNFALEGITGFSVAPLKIATYVGLLTAMSAFIYAVVFMVKTLIWGEAVRGFPTLIVSMLILGGLQLMATGILGEYLGRLFIESKNRPLYLVDEFQLPQTDHQKVVSVKSS